eukprot:58630-Rhodomonas_salina.1
MPVHHTLSQYGTSHNQHTPCQYRTSPSRALGRRRRIPEAFVPALEQLAPAGSTIPYLSTPHRVAPYRTSVFHTA